MKDLGSVTRMALELPQGLQRAQKVGVQRGALHITKGVRGEIRSASGGDSRLSGVGKRGARVGARYDVRGVVNPTAVVKAIGPLQFLEHPTRPHEIRPKRRRRGHRGVLRLPSGIYTTRVQHPGTRASRPFERGYLKTRTDVGRIYDAEVQKAIRQALSF